MNLEHESVMISEVLDGLNIKKDGTYIDATFGRGGHARAILSELGASGQLFALDKDHEAALEADRLAKKDPRFHFTRQSFAQLTSVCQTAQIMGKVSGIVFDLGVSSPQLDTAARGFSFLKAGPLDMRMDTSQGKKAYEWLNEAPETEIQWVLKTYGEERFYKRIAHAIMLARDIEPIVTTERLAEVVKHAHPAWEKHKHPATRAFQAIRIYINNELEEIATALEQALSVLEPGGRLVVISFHSLEDRLVKQFIQKHTQDNFPKDLPLRADEVYCQLRRIGNKQKPSQEEINQNRRARSATLRIAEKLGQRVKIQ